MKVNILLVDDHPLLRSGLGRALEQQPDFVLVGEADTGANGVTETVRLRPDLVVMDIFLPDMSGIDATRQILSATPRVKVVVYSGDADRALVDGAIRAGAMGYVVKSSGADELIHAIGMAMAGRLYLSPQASGGILEDYQNGLLGRTKAPAQALTPRERQLLQLIAEGRRNKDIAANLKLSANTIESYRARLMKKLGYSSTAELVRYAVRKGIVDP
jgi:DNA-binding NarL/FixJ family response regulator